MYSVNDIQVGVSASTREEAIQKGAEVLLKSNKIRKEYVDEIMSVLDKYGPYFVLAPGIAFPHSKPSENVLETGISLITLDKPINFGSEENDPVSIVCTLASKDNNSHLMLLKSMVTFMSDDRNIDFLKSATSEDIKLIVEKLNSIQE